METARAAGGRGAVGLLWVEEVRGWEERGKERAAGARETVGKARVAAERAEEGSQPQAAKEWAAAGKGQAVVVRAEAGFQRWAGALEEAERKRVCTPTKGARPGVNRSAPTQGVPAPPNAA